MSEISTKLPEEKNLILSPTGETLNLKRIDLSDLMETKNCIEKILDPEEKTLDPESGEDINKLGLITNETLNRINLMIKLNEDLYKNAAERSNYSFGSGGESFDPAMTYVN